jgi:hypothetical protein
MTKQILDLGTNANDGTGDTLRSGGTKINANFTELYTILGGDSRNDSVGMLFDSNGVIYNDGTYQTKLEFHEHEDSNVSVHMPHHSGDLIVIESGTGGHHGTDRYIDLKDSDSGSAARILFGNAYDSAGELPSSTVYHGMFAFVHDDGVAVVAHDSDGWVNLIDSDTLTSAHGAYSIDMKTGADQTTFTNLNLVTPYMTSQFVDGNANEILGLTSTGSPANYVQISSNAAADPKIEAVGDSDNVNIEIGTKGNGSICLNKVAYKTQTMTADGAISDSASLVILNKTSATLAATLDSGTEPGEYKILINKSALSATVTPTALANGTSFTLTQNGTAQAIWDGTDWFLIGSKDSADTTLTVTP